MKYTGKAVYIGLTAILAVSLTGCGKKSPLDPGDPVSLTIWHYYNGSQQAAFDALVEEFNDTTGRWGFTYRASVRVPYLIWRLR